MDELTKKLTREIFPLVANPAQYVGGEMNSVVKNHSGRLTFALVFPDTYTIGMSHLGLRILYSVLNDKDTIACERVFCPEPDMETLLRDRRIPLFALESFTPISRFDIVGFSLQYELCYTNILTILDLAGIPFLSKDRDSSHPLILGGGPCCGNPEPLADIFDAFLLGDGEEATPTIAETWLREVKENNRDREEVLQEMSCNIQGFYVPRFFDVKYDEESGQVASITTNRDVPALVRSTIVYDLENAPFPTKPIIPIIPIVHDRITIEIMRGCLNGCRFCAAGMQYRPQRYRSVEKVLEIARESYKASGYDTINLLSLSSSDHPDIIEMLKTLIKEFKPLDVGVSLPSLRVGQTLFELPKIIGETRKSGLTLAPEVATDKMRAIINKDIAASDVIKGATEAFKRGWKLVKLYFMVGLPGEDESDQTEIVNLANKVSFARREFGGQFGDVNVTISTFIPKPHTPFQWARQITAQEDDDCKALLRSLRPYRSVRLKFDKPVYSLLEGLFARGDRRLAETLILAWQKGTRLDAWQEHSNIGCWYQAMEETGVTFEYYCHRERSEEEVLPWDHLCYGPTKEFLLRDKRRSERGEMTDICGKGKCNACMTDIICPNRLQESDSKSLTELE